MFNRPTFLLIAAIGGFCAAGIVPTQAEFRRDRGYNGVQQGYVVAHSRFGNGSVRAA